MEPVMRADTLAHRLAAVRQRIAQAALRCGRRPEEIQLVTVAKGQSAEVVRMALDAGATTIGENYVQESRDKFNALSDRHTRWHFIGHLQRNKAKDVVRIFDLIHSVDSEALANALDKQAQKIGKVQGILVQVNISEEPTKSGISQGRALALVKSISQLSHIRIKGLMTLPPFFNQPELVRPYFVALGQLKERIQREGLAAVDMEELSMGMTGDFEVAIEEGATLVRIGTAIFGERP
jgi:PLP dependent protein